MEDFYEEAEGGVDLWRNLQLTVFEDDSLPF